MPPPQGVVVDISIFYDELAPYGRWFDLDDYGYVWSPYDVSAGWRPYTDGYWTYTDYGWAWVATERWGWAPFHYGRWVLNARFGWVWIPDTVWGPAWVVWRYNPGWVGWAPMPPQPGWRRGARFDLMIDADRYIQPHWYSFVAERNFADRDLPKRLELGARNVTLVRETRNVTNYSVTGDRVMNRSIDPAPIERASGKRIEQRRVTDAPSGGAQGDQVRGNDAIYRRPQVSNQPPNRTPPSAPVATRPAKPEDLQRRDQQERQRLEQEQNRQRQVLERQQQQEIKAPPAQTSREVIQRRQEAERSAQADQRQREQQILQNRQQQRRTETPQRAEPAKKPVPPKGREKKP